MRPWGRAWFETEGVGGGWQRFGTRLASAKHFHVDDHVVRARRKLTPQALHPTGAARKKVQPARGGRVKEGCLGMWVAWGR